MEHLLSVRTHGRTAETLEVGDVIVSVSFHYPFARIVEIQGRMGGLDFTLERGPDQLRSVRSFRKDARVDLVVQAAMPVSESDEQAVDRWLGVCAP